MTEAGQTWFSPSEESLQEFWIVLKQNQEAYGLDEGRERSREHVWPPMPASRAIANKLAGA